MLVEEEEEDEACLLRCCIGGTQHKNELFLGNRRPVCHTHTHTPTNGCSGI